MAVPKNRLSQTRQKMRRANWKLTAPGFVECPQCHEAMMPHHVCPTCGYYKGKPDIQELPYDVKDYDVIAVGTPTWWYTMAPAVKTFLEGHDFTGKTVIPFMTNGGWPGHVIKDMKQAARGAAFGPSIEVQFDSSGGSDLVSDAGDIDDWIKDIKQKYSK